MRARLRSGAGPALSLGVVPSRPLTVASSVAFWILAIGTGSASPLEVGVNTFEHSHDIGTIRKVTRDVADAGMRWVREWVYWPAVESSPGSYDWAAYDRAFGQFADAGFEVLAVATQSPYWAGKFRDPIPPPNRPPVVQSFIPPCRRVVAEPVVLAGSTPSALSQKAPLDHYALVSLNPALAVYSPWMQWGVVGSGHYVVDYPQARIAFSGSLVGQTVYVTYVDTAENVHANVRFDITSSNATTNAGSMQWQPLTATRKAPGWPLLQDGAAHVTAEPTLVEGTDFTIHYAIDGTVARLPGGSIADGATVYVTYDVLHSGAGSPWNNFIGTLASRYQGKVRAIAVWNEASGDGLYFWGARRNADVYAQFVHDSSLAIRAAAPGVLVVDGWEWAHEEVLNVRDARGWKQDVDVLGLHSYPTTPEGLLNPLRDVAAARTRHGIETMPVWLTEVGWPTGPSGQVSLETQADYAVRALAIAASSGVVSHVFWFAYHGYDPVNWGLVRSDFSLKPSYRAVQVFQRMLGGVGVGSTVVWPQETAGQEVGSFADVSRWSLAQAATASAVLDGGVSEVNVDYSFSTPPPNQFSQLTYQLDLPLPAAPAGVSTAFARIVADVEGDGSKNVLLFLVRADNSHLYIAGTLVDFSDRRTLSLDVAQSCPWNGTGCIVGAPVMDRPATLAFVQLLHSPVVTPTTQGRVSFFGSRIVFGPKPLGFEFASQTERVRVVWSAQDDAGLVARLPVEGTPALFDRNGVAATLQVLGQEATFTLGSSPMYLVDLPPSDGGLDGGSGADAGGGGADAGGGSLDGGVAEDGGESSPEEESPPQESAVSGSSCNCSHGTATGAGLWVLAFLVLGRRAKRLSSLAGRG